MPIVETNSAEQEKVCNGATIEVCNGATIEVCNGATIASSSSSSPSSSTTTSTTTIGMSSRELLQIRVCTFNIRFKNDKKDGENRWENRKDAFFEAIESIDADLIGFQEVVDVQFDELAARLQLKYGLCGVARQDGHRQGEFCCTIVSRTPKLSS